MPKLPTRIFVILDPNDNEPTKDLLAYRNAAEAIQDDGPTEVGEYVLKTSNRLAKRVINLIPPTKK